ncbi:MAG: anthranilate phosphoribosyltransferase [Clostridiales bacterium]|uniref:anthranilate phosphoribosyltransferase n=1 Tax=Clostridium sp. N3C TaxID=1776758 RepID=UPI00092E07BE|nr:anthranilate phosphoribosyltransferase [Clostridium sp. N3C]NLZ49452.1 anthranilate phosphoribosyltransferase [Clostridiales bacterium]SCN26439.1 Anthranilate phosphoribosyltransferase [Clostridium sp. N3C]
MLSDAIKKIVLRENLTELEAEAAMNEIMKGEFEPSLVGAFLIGLRMKGESIDEITGCVKSMKKNAKSFNLDHQAEKERKTLAIDTCGTGGDEANTFNISTAVAIIAAAAGVRVAKHGGRAVSSNSGSADVLAEMGFNINIDAGTSEQCIRETGMTFLFAPNYHPAMKYAAPIRKQLSTRTIFNIIGPLTNPADIKGQVLGVFDKGLTNKLGQVLLKLGRERALVVHGHDGLDEITTTAKTTVTEVKDGKVIDYVINPEDYGIPLSKKEDIQGGDAKENARIILDIFKGQKGPKRDIVLINAAAALYVGKAVDGIYEGVKLAEEIIDSGKAYDKLKEIVNFSRRVAV